jgi:hypothetical protein
MVSISFWQLVLSECEAIELLVSVDDCVTEMVQGHDDNEHQGQVSHEVVGSRDSLTLMWIVIRTAHNVWSVRSVNMVKTV